MSGTPTSQNGTMSAQKVDYQAVKAWIPTQEAYEAANKQPALLTAAQRKAVAELARVIPAPMTQGVEVDDKDYISILQRKSSPFAHCYHPQL